MIAEPLEIPGLVLLRPRVARDARGHFLETWRADRYAAAGIPSSFAQDNVSVSRQGVLRGLHFQHPNSQGKLVTTLAGTIFDVAVDVRRGSPTFGRWVGCELSAETGHQLWIPPGFAHGFSVTAGDAIVAYKCTEHYAPADERSVRWNDPAIAIRWPIDEPILSPKDADASLLSGIAPECLPPFDGG